MTDQSIAKARTAGVKGAEVTVQTTGLTIERLYTTAGVHPYDEVEW
jgi:ribonucleoside-diphosphate reductase alpha chain